MIRVTFDTSVYIRAFTTGGSSALFLGYARAGYLRIDVSDAILQETIRVLRDKFCWDGYMLQNVRSKLLGIANHVSPSQKLQVIIEDPDDNHVLECALEAGSDFIVSEDKDLLRLHSFRNTRIVNIVTFAAIVTSRSPLGR